MSNQWRGIILLIVIRHNLKRHPFIMADNQHIIQVRMILKELNGSFQKLELNKTKYSAYGALFEHPNPQYIPPAG